MIKRGEPRKVKDKKKKKVLIPGVAPFLVFYFSLLCENDVNSCSFMSHFCNSCSAMFINGN